MPIYPLQYRALIGDQQNERLLKICDLSMWEKRAPCVNAIIESRHWDHLSHNCYPAYYPVSEKIENREDALRRLRETFDENTIFLQSRVRKVIWMN